MKIYLKKFGKILVSRPAGREAFLALQPQLKEITGREKIEIDCGDIIALTPSWADEFITPLLRQYKKRALLVNTENPSVKATLETLKKAEAALKK